MDFVARSKWCDQPEAQKQIIEHLVPLGEAGYLRHQEGKEFRTAKARLNVQKLKKSGCYYYFNSHESKSYTLLM